MATLAEGGAGEGDSPGGMDLPTLFRTLGGPRNDSHPGVGVGPQGGSLGDKLTERVGDAAPNSTLRPHLPWYLLSDYAALLERHRDAAQPPGTDPAEVSGLAADVVEFLHQYYVPAMIAMGLVGNLLSCIVFLNTHLRLRSSSYYLAALATADFGYLAVLVLVWLDSVHGLQVFDKEGWCQVVTYVSSVCAFVSVWLIVAFTVERFIAVQYPLHRPHMCTVARAKAIVACIAAFGVVAHTYTLLMRGIVRDKDGYESCEMLVEHRSVMRVITLVDAIVTLVVPVVLIIVMNTMITRNLVLFGRRFKQAGVAGDDTAANSWADCAHGLGAESCDSRSSNAQSSCRRQPCQPGGPFAFKVSGSGGLRMSHGAAHSTHAAHAHNAGTSTTVTQQQQAADPPDVTLCLGPSPKSAVSPLSTPAPLHYASQRAKHQAIDISAGRTLVSTRTQQSITKMLLLISSVFITLNLPSHVLRVYASVAVFTGSNLEVTNTSSPSLWFGQQIAMLLYYTNFSINFLLYSMCGITFRRCLWQLVRGAGRYCGCGCDSHWSECQFR